MATAITPTGHYIPLHIAVQDHSSKMNEMDVAFQVEACRLQLKEHIAPAWDAEPPGMSWLGKSAKLKPDEAALLSFVDSDGNADSAGYHAQLGTLVYGLVDVNQSGDPGVTLSHEAGEMYANARLERVIWGPNDWRYYVELMDPTQDQTYTIKVTLFGMTRYVKVSDFVYPAWFGLKNPNGTTKTTHMNQPLKAFEVAPGGYQIVLAKNGQTLFLNQGPFGMRRSKHSRTGRIMQGVGGDPKPKRAAGV
jgi:hypothetical protein